jgi:hypothetical protein
MPELQTPAVALELDSLAARCVSSTRSMYLKSINIQISRKIAHTIQVKAGAESTKKLP